MSKKFKDTDYLMLSSMLRAREAGMLSRERMDRMLSAPSFAEAAKLLVDCGYEDMSSADATGIDAALSRRRAAVFAELSGMVPQPEAVDIFRLKYDYHNLKVLVKSAAAGVDGEYLLSGCGRVGAEALKSAVAEGELGDLPADMAAAYAEAASVLNRTGNPQLADFGLDAAYFAEALAMAGRSGSAFLKSYVQLLIDSANLRTAVRTVRMGKDREFMDTALVPGGAADAARLAMAAAGGEALAAVFHATPLAAAAALGADAMKGGPLTDFELACDNAVSAYLSAAKMKPFGIEAVVEYIYLLELEITAARMILTGRLAGIEPEVIRERLRDIDA